MRWSRRIPALAVLACVAALAACGDIHREDVRPFPRPARATTTTSIVIGTAISVARCNNPTEHTTFLTDPTHAAQTNAPCITAP